MGDARLNMSLNDVVKMNEKKDSGNRRTSNSLVARGNSNTRSQRQAAPYSSSAPPKHKDGDAVYHHERVAIKFLLSHNMAGSLIGNGGQSIKELMDITGAEVHVSNVTDHYPGTNLRTVYITGSDGQVSLAQSLMWELIGMLTDAANRNVQNTPWNPSYAYKNPGRFDSVEVEGKITVPAGAAGAVLGKGGATIKSIGEVSDVTIAMCSKEDGFVTRERMITISGQISGCMNATSLVIHKLAEEEDGYDYTINGTTYPKALHEAFSGSSSRDYRDNGRDNGRDNRDRGHNSFFNAGHRGDRDGDRYDRYDRSDGRSVRSDYDYRNSDNMSYSSRSRAPSTADEGYSHGRRVTDIGDRHSSYKAAVTGGGNNVMGMGASLVGIAETLSANTEITLAVPDTLIGAILGPQGATLNEIVNLSGSKVIVSKRGEYLDDQSRNRLVTITGGPASAQTAHTLIVHKLRQFSSEIEQDL